MIRIFIIISLLLFLWIPKTCLSQDIEFGEEYVFNPGMTWPLSTTTLDENHTFIAYSDYEDWTGKGNALIASVYETSITYGNEFMFHTYPKYISAAALDENHALIAYQDGTNLYGRARVASITDDTISYGTESPYASGNDKMYYTTVAALNETNALIAYSYISDEEETYGHVSLVSIEDSEISIVFESIFNDDETYNISLVALDSTHALIAYSDDYYTRYGTARIASISGTNLILGEAFVFNNDITCPISASKIDENHALIAYANGSNSNYGTAKIASISENNISFSDEFIFNYSTTWEISATSLSNDYVLITYDKSSTSKDRTTAIIAEIDGTNITFGQEYIFNASPTYTLSATSLDTTHALIAYQDVANNDYGTAIIAELASVAVTPEEESQYIFSENKNNNYPNPFSSLTTIEYSISGGLKAEPVEIYIYNVLGQLVKTIEATHGTAQLDMSDMTPGIYFFEIETDNYDNIQKMILIR